jgi:hypothetical protein
VPDLVAPGWTRAALTDRRLTQGQVAELKLRPNWRAQAEVCLMTKLVNRPRDPVQLAKAAKVTDRLWKLAISLQSPHYRHVPSTNSSNDHARSVTFSVSPQYTE